MSNKRARELGHDIPTAGTLEQLSYCRKCGASVYTDQPCPGKRVFDDALHELAHEFVRVTGAEPLDEAQRVLGNDHPNTTEREFLNSDHYLIYLIDGDTWITGASSADDPLEPPNEEIGDKIIRLEACARACAYSTNPYDRDRVQKLLDEHYGDVLEARESYEGWWGETWIPVRIKKGLGMPAILLLDNSD